MTKLQLAIDLIDEETIFSMIPELMPYVDIYEMGTPFILKYGETVVERFHKAYPDIDLLADIKIMDGGGIETKMFCDCGAKYITVMARTNDSTIAECAKTAHEYGSAVAVDMMCVDDFKNRVPELEELGVDMLVVHVAYDQYTKYGLTPIKSLAELSELTKTAQTAVAGGIKLDTVKDYLKYNPNVIVVGGDILNAEDPVDMARRYSEIIREGSNG